MKNISKRFYLSSIIICNLLYFFCIGLGVYYGLIGHPENISIIIFSSIVFIIIAFIIEIDMWGRAWGYIQDDHPRTTPGRAIGFLFIPFYNIYWIFQVIKGFAEDYNKYITEKGFASKIGLLPKGSFSSLCIIRIITIFLSRTIFGLLLFFIEFIILLIVVSKVCDAINDLGWVKGLEDYVESQQKGGGR